MVPNFDQQGFANAFLVHPKENKDEMQITGPADPQRKKRAHNKSRRGCIACKKRRVKASPCDGFVECLCANDPSVMSKSLARAV